MYPLSANDILRIHEQGCFQHPLDRALTILQTAITDTPRDALALLSIGDRDRKLLDLRERTFGPVIGGYAKCPQCGDELEYDLHVPELKTSERDDCRSAECEWDADGFQLWFRMPNSIDLAAMVGYQSTARARNSLIERCVSAASCNGEKITPAELPPKLIEKLAAHVAEIDPQAEILLQLSCPACAHKWTAVLDIAGILWSEISAEARRLLREIAALAKAYGWRETDILAMSPVRRHWYLELAY